MLSLVSVTSLAVGHWSMCPWSFNIYFFLVNVPKIIGSLEHSHGPIQLDLWVTLVEVIEKLQKERDKGGMTVENVK